MQNTLEVSTTNIDLSEEQQELQRSIRRFMQKEVVPIVAQHEKERTFPFELMPKLAQLG